MTYGYDEESHPYPRDQRWQEPVESQYGAQIGQGPYGTGRHLTDPGRPPTPQGYPPQPPGAYGDGELGAAIQHQIPPQYADRPAHYDHPIAYGGAASTDYDADPRRHEPGGRTTSPSGKGSRQAAARNGKRRHRKRLAFLIMIMMLAAGGAGGWYYWQHRPTSEADQRGLELARKIANQDVDAEPLTVVEVFRSATVPAPSGGGPYKVVKTQASSSCATAVAGDLVAALAAAGCTQVVRATLLSPDDTIAITTGIFNLADDKKAQDATGAIKKAVDANSGRFGGMVAGGPTNHIARAAANVAWDVRGHYLLYCLITKADGSAIPADDRRTQSTIKDLLDEHLIGVVIHYRQSSDTMKVNTST